MLFDLSLSLKTHHLTNLFFLLFFFIFIISLYHFFVSQYLSELLKQHVEETGSARAARALANIDDAMSKCWLVLPAAEKKNPIAISSDAAVKSAADVVV